jgi:outer membrane protein OmpA-like peptidoglycan-associated protein
MNKYIVFISLLLTTVYTAFSQVDSNSANRDGIKQQAIEIRNKVNNFVNQSTSKTPENGQSFAMDSIFRFMTEMKTNYTALQNKLDSVKEDQAALLKYNNKLERKIKIYKEYPYLPSQLENKDKRTFTIYYKSASTVVDPLFVTDLKEWLQTIPPNSALHIEGFADDIGSFTKNRRLSSIRALQVQKLVNQLSNTKIKSQTKGRGAFRLTAKSNQLVKRQLSRRVLLYY